VRKSATIRDVAKEAGVSIAVVSRVMNDGTGPVAPDTRARVVDAMERLRYQPRAAAREMQQQSTTTLGLVLADLTNPFFARLADRVVWEARSRGVHVVLLTTQEDPHLEAESIDTLIGRSVGAVIATPTGGNLDKWSRLSELGVNVVFVDREIDDLAGIDVVTIGNQASAETATEHLLAFGHRRIGFISGPLSTSTGRDRIAGFRTATARAGLDLDEQLIHAIPFRGDSGGDAVSALLALPDCPTGLIIANTAQVRSALHRVKQTGINVPSDLSLIVFDDNPWTELVSPPLTVVRQPIDLLAVHSIDLAVSRLRGGLTEGPRRIQVEAEFVQRSSTGPRRLVETSYSGGVV
jgi:LacI family transcriptional regulator